MMITFTKTPLLIAALATALTVTSLNAANADVVWAGAATDTDIAQVYDAGFKKHGFKKHGGFKHKAHTTRLS